MWPKIGYFDGIFKSFNGFRKKMIQDLVLSEKKIIFATEK